MIGLWGRTEMALNIFEDIDRLKVIETLASFNNIKENLYFED